MPRTERKQSKTGIYHIMLRGINKQLIFEEPEDYTEFLSCLSDVKAISCFKLYAYCLMGNHVHLLLKEEAEPLSQIFRRLGARYVFWFNWKYERTGHLFQDRFKSEPIESEEYFIMALMYLYQNPVKAGLCKHPKDYEWCSRRFLGMGGIVDEAELLGKASIESIMEMENEEISLDFLEPRIGRRMAMSDEEAFGHIKKTGGVKSVMEFQSLDRESQGKTLAALHRLGASQRQLARLSGLSRPVVARLCQGAGE